MGFAVELIHGGSWGLALPQGSSGVQGLNHQWSQGLKSRFGCSSNARSIKSSWEEAGPKAKQSQRWCGNGTPAVGCPEVSQERCQAQPPPSPPPASPARNRPQPGCPRWGNNLGCSCWGANHPKLAILTPKLRAHSPFLHSQHCQKPPEPQHSNSSVCTARRATRLGVIHPLHSVNI